MGVAVHEAIMEWEKSNRELDIYDKYKEVYDREVNDSWTRQPDERYWFLPPLSKSVTKSINTYRSTGFGQIETYIEYAESAPWEAQSLERQFEIDLDGITVRGAVDRILFYPSSEEFIVEDLKTGSPKEEDDFRQLAFYAFVARTLWDIPVNVGRYWFTKVNRASEEFTFRPELLTSEYWSEQFHLLDMAIGLNIFLPSPGSSCGLCPVRPWCRSQGWLEIGEML